ncbi:DUF1286 domain-containing protein [Conexivisphaera calida]|uniref:DUF1286 domain-containing protein n=1 Tax=Conexivisphaera calida TaxID=1874277 RepID=A0A4P2VLT4_9ARCH|nr:DUF1286 domain-containing protein [Conexivisphaera calida]BBE42058.1 hypothetical protein NAS2_0669 [Conexivisphaera calida]
MKLTTHYLFTIGLVALIACPILPLSGALVVAIWLGVATNWIVDMVGHEDRDGAARRTAATHSLPGAAGVGLVLGVLPVALVALFAPTALIAAGVQLSEVPFIALLMGALGILAGLSHLLLDALTEGGIYHRGRRWAIAHWRYDCAAANMPFALLGLLMLACAMVGL